MASESTSYKDIFEHLYGAEKVALRLAHQQGDVTNRDERGALGLAARRAARAYALLAETFELLSDPPIDGSL